MKSPLRVSLKAVRERGSLQLRESVPAAPFQACLSGQAALTAPLAVSLELTVEGGQVAVRGGVQGRWELECCRCLSRRPQDFSARVEGRLDAAAEALDAAEEVRQALVLAVPLKPVCRPDCRGLCAACGVDLNAGPCACAPLPAGNSKP